MIHALILPKMLNLPVEDYLTKNVVTEALFLLSMALSFERGFSSEDFALNHPGGDIGRSLLTCSEIMRKGDEVCVVQKDTMAKEVLHRITSTKGRPGAACIVDGDGILVGVFTDGDLRRCLEKEPGFLDSPISSVMGKTPKTIAPHNLATEALALMNTHKIDQIIVIGASGKPEGMIDIQDLAGWAPKPENQP